MIACIFYKRILQRAIDHGNEPLPESAQRHVSQCLACRQSYELERELARRLAADAPTERHSHEPSPFLRGRIMASIERAGERAALPGWIPKAAPRFLHPAWVAAVVVIGLGLISLSLLQRMPHSNPAGQGGGAPLSVSSQPRVTGQLASAVPGALEQNVFEWSKALDQPLETEMKSVVSDAKTAIQLLAGNFLPETGEIISNQ